MGSISARQSQVHHFAPTSHPPLLCIQELCNEELCLRFSASSPHIVSLLISRALWVNRSEQKQKEEETMNLFPETSLLSWVEQPQPTWLGGREASLALHR